MINMQGTALSEAQNARAAMTTPTVGLARILNDLGTNSVRELFRRTGSSEQSVFKQAQIASIESFYKKTGGFKGPLGLPLGGVEFTGLTAARRYAGGQIAFQSDGPQGTRTTAVRVRFVGFRCLKESDHDQSTGSDEPYFLIGVVATNGSTLMRRGPYEKVNTKSVREEVTEIASAGITGNNQNLTPPIALGVVAMEHDHGSPKEAEAKVRKVLVEIEKKVDQAAATFGVVQAGSHVMSDWMRDIVIGWVPEWGAALLGMGDDEVGKTAMVLFDNQADLKEWRAPAVIGKHGPNEYNLVLKVGGGDEGEYNLYFKVDLFELSATIVAPA